MEIYAKISDYIKDLDSHDIYSHEDLAAEFTEQTGIEPCWPTHSPEATVEAINNRGLGGVLAKSPAKKLAYGYQIAEALAKKYANFTSNKEVRGFRFRECVNALIDKGY